MIITSTGPAAVFRHECLGRYEIVNGLRLRGRPVWKLEETEMYLSVQSRIQREEIEKSFSYVNI